MANIIYVQMIQSNILLLEYCLNEFQENRIGWMDMNHMTPDYSQLVVDLEQQELESSLGTAASSATSPQVYGQLLAIYLLINDLYVY